MAYRQVEEPDPDNHIEVGSHIDLDRLEGFEADMPDLDRFGLDKFGPDKVEVDKFVRPMFGLAGFAQHNLESPKGMKAAALDIDPDRMELGKMGFDNVLEPFSVQMATALQGAVGSRFAAHMMMGLAERPAGYNSDYTVLSVLGPLTSPQTHMF